MNKTEFKKVMVEKGLTQNSLAKLMNITPPTLSRKIKLNVFSYDDLRFLKNLFGLDNFIKIFFEK